jgi:hypothetical protein
VAASTDGPARTEKPGCPHEDFDPEFDAMPEDGQDEIRALPGVLEEIDPLVAEFPDREPVVLSDIAEIDPPPQRRDSTPALFSVTVSTGYLATFSGGRKFSSTHSSKFIRFWVNTMRLPLGCMTNPQVASGEK